MLYATQKQIAFIKKLADERQVKLDLAFIDMSSHEASQLISDLLAKPKVNTGCLHVSEIKVGLYEDIFQRIIRVVPSRTTDFLYGEYFDENLNKFIYAKGIIHKLVKRLDLDEVKGFGKAFGVCGVCARLLTNPESIAAGIGPICAMKY